MELVIRDAVVEDAPAIAQLNRDGMGYDYPVERTREKLRACLGNPSHKILVAESEGVVVGYVHLEDYDTLYADSLKNILGIAVAESCRLHRGRRSAPGLRGKPQGRPRLLSNLGLYRQ